ncbi:MULTISPECIES: DUF262 domain-containing HNH endonuclease family protein [unclassified Agrobacterium]|uniref:DUF262 domain-containing protein n=1 Tax=unclassified Agrobacterium TaxID=2632611 RepID=UPI002447FF67|nr:MULTISPECIES: DUF262 domain-containing HNH endonuclease family protein [unclassified Agrobacterium]MDH0611945.1 DUF262 domain-containing HNH endonuclease family protein [Agrobacterium sp. GD03872]MDH0695842.1 DUF262 domain-containing HNH endonuclease family protein [Agrobacterium sp. GD03871]MDH1058884.1 DUF262 domain-containing HNH endonuclease family protein [Agrobacterium sp. GD03992]MDH2210975.1 DUF262 domain-containing HNH endonuclease family protein [Agrobacterium sp. GD03643]MDH22176
MEASERTISQILTEQIRYEIPPYQRPYSWEKGNVEQLLDDVWEAYEAGDEEYFIGSLITIERQKGVLYDVVDGQQRLTTLNLIFAKLREKITDPYAMVDLEARVRLPKKNKDDESKPRLTLRNRDQTFYLKHVLDKQPVSAVHKSELEKTQDKPKLNILENTETIDRFCEDKDEKTIQAFKDYLLDRVFVVLVATQSTKSAYRLFNVLNARGMPLSNADLIKNLLFAQLVGGRKSEELEERWLELEEIIGIDRLDQFFAHHRSSFLAIKSRKSLHEEFEPLIAKSADPFTFLEEVTASAKNYVRILQANFDDSTALRSLRSLHRVAFEEWIPPLLAFLNKPVIGMTEAEFIVLLEKITYQNWVRRLAFTARLTVYFQLINAIRDGKNAEEVIAVFQASANDAEFKTLLDGEVYGRPFAHAVLMRLEEADQDESVTKTYRGKITIEHVLPQALKDAYWIEKFAEEQHRAWLHRLGNLALLAGTKNYRAQYFSFDRKKQIYAEKNKIVSFDTTKQILAVDQWTSEQVSSRQDILISKAMDVWAIG